ncbi:MAG: acyltransferase [Microthrixaceae bacterium]|nr:acyltransferase [Microthrixaceae bacterium]
MTSHSETTAFIEMSGSDGPRLVQLPGLDGLRGVAVIAVVAYHMGFERMSGGYLGVSTFFTLSGFLITSILVHESQRTSRISLAGFWSRRFRRLMPAALVTLALIALVFGRTIATADQRLALRGDTLAALFYIANWRFILSGSKYGDLTSAPSPVLHFWSLSIEEQFYVIFPILILLLFALARGRRIVIGAVLALLALVSSVLPWIFTMSTNRAYLGSDVRAAEILLGGVTALVLADERVRRSIAVRYRPRAALLSLAGVCAAVQILWFVTVEQSTTWLYRGGLQLFAVMTCVVIAASALPVGPFRLALGTQVMRWVGTRSYGIYLIHWPLIIGARQIWPSASNLLRSSGAVVLALVLAELSFRVIETPVRIGKWPSRQKAFQVAAASVAVVAVVGTLPIPVDRSQVGTDFESAADRLADIKSSIVPSTTAQTTTTVKPTPPAVPKMSIFGDSTSVLASLGFATSIKNGTTTQLAYSGGDAVVGCGISRFERVRLLDDSPPDPKCSEWPLKWTASIMETDPDIAAIITGSWEVVDAQLPGTQNWTAIGDPAADDFIRSELNEAVRVASSGGALVILWQWPPFAAWADDSGRAAVARQHQTDRMERLHQIMSEVAEANPTTVRLFDLSAYLGPERLADRSIRPDGLHIPTEVIEQMFADGLSQKMLDIYLDWWHSQPH